MKQYFFQVEAGLMKQFFVN